MVNRNLRSKPRGALLHSPQSRHGDKVFFCQHGQRHWIMDGAWVAQNGFVWQDDLQTVSPSVIDAFAPGRRAPLDWDDGARLAPPRTGVGVMREVAVSGLRGSAVEFGAGANAMPIPLDCTVRYADIYTLDELQLHEYEGQTTADLLRPDIIASLDDMSVISDGSVDVVRSLLA